MLTLEERIEKYSMPVTESGCVLWTGNLSSEGYGRINIDGKIVYIHRIVYALCSGAIPEGLFICHKCDVTCCINPNHLFSGTHSDNMRDKIKKGRGRGGSLKGELHGQSKLDYKQVTAIRADSDSQRTIAKKYGISQRLVGKIKRKELWKHM